MTSRHMDRVYYDRDRYYVYLSDSRVVSSYFRVNPHDIVTMVDKVTGESYTDLINGDNIGNDLTKLELAGGIFILPTYSTYKAVVSCRVFETKYNGNYIHIDYDGATHLVIEDIDYIYRVDLPHYVEIDISYEDNIYLIRYDIGAIHHLIIVSKDVDYVELLNVEGNDIDILDDSIVVTRIFSDSLGRIRRDTYSISDDKYILSNSEFSYTYSEVSSRCAMADIEEAVYARDYQYIANRMIGDVDATSLKEYFGSILSQDYCILAIEPLSRDELHFVTSDGRGKHLVSIAVTYDGDRIANFDRREYGV